MRSLLCGASSVALRFAIGCLVLASAGCDAGVNDAIERHELAAALPVELAPGSSGDRPNRHNLSGLGRSASFFALADTSSNISKDPSPFRFVDIHAGSGIEFVHVSGNDRRKLYPTAFGSGAAMLDYDGDGNLDLYFATCARLPMVATGGNPNRLYRNAGAGKFQDVTAASGLGFVGFCHGVIAGDIDNDGDPDVFLCNFGSNALYLNGGDGTFRDISRSAGIDRPNWSSGGAMLDYDSDGDLDIYVANYGDWIYPRDVHRCGNDHIPLFCSPWEIQPAKHILYRNNGDLTFTDVTDQAGIGRSRGRGFGVVAADLNGDGRVDLYVANDLNPNFLFLNRGDGTFEDVTEIAGTAYDERGLAQSSMGVDAEDCDGDGRPELFVTNFQNEHIAYYQNLSGTAPIRSGELAPALFRESAAGAGLVIDSKPWVGWGCALADFDNDGWPDAFVANGHLDDNRKDLAPTMSYPEPPLLYRNVSGGTVDPSDAERRFELSTRDAGPYLVTRHVARGAAFGDLDNDGDLDIVINHMDGAPAILRNDTPTKNAWLRLKLIGTQSNRDAIGARVDVTAAGRTISRQRKGGCSMQSTSDPRLLIGLGAVTEISRVSIRWPSGAITILEHLTPNKAYEVTEPQTGKPAQGPSLSSQEFVSGLAAQRITNR
jgi:enediyne biosynthesis protein E4